MNELSWLIYAADVAGDVNAVCATVFYGGAAGLALYSVGKGFARVAMSRFDDAPVTPSIAAVGKKLWLPILIAGLIGVATPSAGTFYAIAASEMGERALASETAGKAVEALNAWLDRQIAPATPDSQ